MRSLDLIEDLARNPSEAAMASVVASAIGDSWGVDEIGRLAEVLARSGNTLTFPDDIATADVASTGAPSSLSTLLCPLYLRNLGFQVPKLGVPGRPAGGIDVLAQVPGYKADLDAAAARAALDRCGYAHFLAGPDFAPLDATLFRYRQKSGAQDVPPLAVASILAKKIACGVKSAGLDVRVAPHGNFGGDFASARQTAKSFCLAAKAVGISAVAGLTDARTPYQPYIGRGEALLALSKLIDGSQDQWLLDHADRCLLLAAHVSALHPARGSLVKEIGKPFFENIAAQGGTEDGFLGKAEAIARAPRTEIAAQQSGFFSLDLAGLRSAFVTANAPANEEPFPDNLGLILRKRPGSFVRNGEILASVRATQGLWPSCAPPLMKCFRVVELMDYAVGLEEFVRA
ncbi:thymidine phosphorylase [Bradyrhizobium sp. USDA 4011]